MKLIREYTEQEDAIAFQRKLRLVGIASQVAINKGNNQSIYGGGIKSHGVWALLESQYNDAMLLRKGNNHVVKNPLSEEELIEVEQYRKKKTLPRFYLLSALFIISFAVLSIALIVLFSAN